MINVIDEVLAGEPKYTITHNDNTTEEVSIDLATTVTTQGTPLNKALFDSIDNDIQARVLISDKATTAEAQALTNDSHYITPLKVKEGLQYLTKTGTASQTTTMLDMTETVADTKRIKVSGSIISGAFSSLKVNGTGLYNTYAEGGSNTSSSNVTSFSLAMGKPLVRNRLQRI